MKLSAVATQLYYGYTLCVLYVKVVYAGEWNTLDEFYAP